MKRIVASILILTSVMSLDMTVSAATIGTGGQDIDVKGKYQDNSTAATVYSVDIGWGAMEFTYTESGSMIWNPVDHTYAGSTSAAWIANGDTVTVTNHSNAEVTASFAFNALDAYNTVTGSFDITSEKLDAGVVNGYDVADKVVATLTLDGILAETVTDYTKIGIITVTIA